MKIEVKKIDATKRELKFEIPKDRVTKTMEEIYAEVGKGAKIKGFRPGKAPRHLVEAHYGKLVQEETIKKIIPEVYHEGIEKENISPIDLPEIEDVHFKDGVISFKARLDIRPEVKIKDYKGIKITRKDSQVTDEEINKTLEFFKIIDDFWAFRDNNRIDSRKGLVQENKRRIGDQGARNLQAASFAAG